MSKKVDMVVQTYGFDALEKTFDNFAHKEKKTILNAAFRKATNPMTDMARGLAPVGKTGNLRKSIGQVPMRETVGIWIGARVIGGYRGSHGHLVEDGTVERSYITRKGNKHSTGKMNPSGRYAGFMRRAVKSTEEQAINTLSAEWYNAIGRMIVRKGMDK